MAEVYVAKTRGIGGFEKLVAIKVIHPRYSEDDHFIQMLVEEAKISVQLSHVNIAQTFDLGCIDNVYFIAMEYIEGADAYRVVKRAYDKTRSLPVDLCCYIGAEVCHGLAYAHRKRDAEGRPMGIVHRDISPQNVLISYAGEVKLVDFGIAKAALRTGQTEVGVIKGKYYYMSPEQSWGDPVDQRSDVFSTGLLLHELLTGEMVYKENNVPALLDQVRKAEIDGPASKRSDIPLELDRVVMRALAKEPVDRYQSAHALAQELTEILYRMSPTFTSGKLASLMSDLFAEAPRRPTQITQLPSSNSSPLIESGSSPLDEATGSGPQLTSDPTFELPRSTSVEHALESMSRDEFTPSAESSVIFDLNAAGDESTRNDLFPLRRDAPGRSVETDRYPSVAEDGSTATSRMSSGSDWEEETFLKSKTEWDESTVVDEEGESFVGAHRQIVAARRAANLSSDELQGEATVATASPLGLGEVAPPQRPVFAQPPPRPGQRPIPPPPSRGGARPNPAGPHGGARKPSSIPPPARLPPRPPSMRAPPVPRAQGAPAFAIDPDPGLPPLSGELTQAEPDTHELRGEPTAALVDYESIQSARRSFQDAGPSTGGIRLGPEADRFFHTPASEVRSTRANVSASGFAEPPTTPVNPHGPAPSPIGVGYAAAHTPPTAPGPPAPAPVSDPFVARPPVATGAQEAQLGKPQPLRWLIAAAGLAAFLFLVIAVGAYFASRPEDSSLEILSVPEGAAVVVDGQPLAGHTPVHLDAVETGAHVTIQLRLEGYEPRTEEITVLEGSNRSLIVLNPQQVSLHIETVPTGAQVWLDEVHRGNSPLDVTLSAGQRVRVRARVPGRPEVQQTFTAEPNEMRPTLTLSFPGPVR